MRLMWRWRGPCPAWKGADDAQAGVFLVSYFIYKTCRAVISLRHQTLQTAGRWLLHVGCGEELGAGCCSRASGFTSNHAQKPNEASSQIASSRIPIGDTLSSHWCICTPWFPPKPFRSLSSWRLSAISHHQKLSTTLMSPSQVCSNHIFDKDVKRFCWENLETGYFDVLCEKCDLPFLPFYYFLWGFFKDVLHGFLMKGGFEWKHGLLVSFGRFILAKILPVKVISHFFSNIEVATVGFFLL